MQRGEKNSQFGGAYAMVGGENAQLTKSKCIGHGTD